MSPAAHAVENKARRIREDYADLRPLYEAFTRSVSEVMQQLLETYDIDSWTIETRTKSAASLAEKITRAGKQEKYDALEDITDLAGVRIVAFLQEDCRRICQIIESNFEIDEANSANKEALLDPDQFGYLSVHYVATYVGARLALPEFHRFLGLKVEIQVRTVLQHAWAAIDWKLRYKSAAIAPSSVRRRLYRISALLEAADDEFSSVSADALALRHQYEAALARGDLNIPVDDDSIQLYLEKSAIVARLVKQVEKRTCRYST